jgi:hypothetical protein
MLKRFEPASSSVGTSGNADERFAVDTASAQFPALDVRQHLRGARRFNASG